MMKQSFSQRPTWLKFAPNKVDIVFFDLETTGGNPSNSSIIEIGAIKYSDGKEVGRLETLVKPKHHISRIVQKITGIHNHMVKNAPAIEDIFEEFIRFIGDSILVSHGASADIAFFAHYSEKILNTPFKNYFLCTHLLVSHFLPDLPSKRLTSVGEHFDFEVKYAHTALDDAIITDHIFWKLYNFALSKGFSSCEDLLKLQGDQASLKKLGIGFDANLLNSAPSMSGVLYILGSEQEITYLSASPNLRKSLSKIIELSQENKDFQKILVDASGFKVERTASYLDALLREKSELRKLTLPLDPRLLQHRSEKFLQIFIPTDLLQYAKKNPKSIAFKFPEHNAQIFDSQDDLQFADEHYEVSHTNHLRSQFKETKKTLQFINTFKYQLDRKNREQKKIKDFAFNAETKSAYFGYLREGVGYAFGPFVLADTITPHINALLKKYPFEQKNLPIPTRFNNLIKVIKGLNAFENQSSQLKSGLVIISNNAFKEFEIFVVVRNQIIKKTRLKFEEGDRLKSSRYFTRLFKDYYDEIKNPTQPIIFTNDACDEIELFSYWLAEKHGEGEWIEFTALESLFDKSLCE